MGDSAFRRIKTPSVGKGIRSNVHNSHQHASARHIQYVSPYKPVHLITFLSKPLYITLISQKLFFHHENNAPASLHPPAHDVRALAAGQDDFNVQTASSRMVKHEDGSRSYFEKTGDGKGMKKTTYNIRNVLVSVTLYKRGPFGELRSCLIFDGQKNELFFVRYGYDGNANLREEQMFDSRTKELVRRFLYTYDAMGNRSKPVCITLVKSTKDIETHAVPTAPEKDPFADDFKKKNK